MVDNGADAVINALKGASIELRDVDVGNTVDRMHISRLTPLFFLTQYVAKNKPVIIQGSIDDWPALDLWDEQYLVSQAGSTPVTVDLTPTGRGDAVTKVVKADRNKKQELVSSATGWVHACTTTTSATISEPTKMNVHAKSELEAESSHSAESSPSAVACERWFITPCEVKMDVSSFFKLFRSSRSTSGRHRVVPYVQHQNSSFTEEWAFLEEDIQPGLTWADEVFGGVPPDATNLWIGDERSVTSYHKDHYENLYAVIRGTKIFHLLPPSDMYRMNIRSYPLAKYTLQSQGSQVTGLTQPVDQSSDNSTPCAGTKHTGCGENDNKDSFLVQVSPGTDSGREENSKHVQLVLGDSCLVPDPCTPGTSSASASPRASVLWSDVEPPEASTPGVKQYYDSGSSPEQQQLYHDATLPPPLIAEVGPGEVLYLPAMWYHRVSQACSQADEGYDYVMAVNFWYDMAFDSKWAHAKLVESLAVAAGLADPTPPMNGDN